MHSAWLGPAFLILAALIIVGILYYWDEVTTPQPLPVVNVTVEAVVLHA